MITRERDGGAPPLPIGYVELTRVSRRREHIAAIGSPPTAGMADRDGGASTS
jgi:hypothetical protein